MFGHPCTEVARYLLDHAEERKMALSPMKLMGLIYNDNQLP